jgi:hypothetical protein
VAGIAAGVALAALVVYHIPAAQKTPAPVDVGDRGQLSLDFSAVVEDTILYTNDGDSAIAPHPRGALELWEPTIDKTSLLVTTLRNMNGESVGLGIKFVSLSEETKILNGEYLANSVWYVYLPGRGTLLVQQSEDYFEFMRDIVVTAHWSSANSWRGNWRGMLTSGPDPLGNARVYGGSGEFRDVETEAIETLTASAYSAVDGPVAVEGRLLLELPIDDKLSADRR